MRVPLPEFRLEAYFSHWEFAAKYHLTASDAQTLTVAELLALGTEAERDEFAALPLGYVETWGSNRLRTAIASTYSRCDADDVLVFAGGDPARDGHRSRGSLPRACPSHRPTATPTGLDLLAGEVHVKSGQLGPDQPAIVKVASGFPGKPRRGLPQATVRCSSSTRTPGDCARYCSTTAGSPTSVLRQPPPSRSGTSPLRGCRDAWPSWGPACRPTLRSALSPPSNCCPPETAVWGRDHAAAQRLAARTPVLAEAWLSADVSAG